MKPNNIAEIAVGPDNRYKMARPIVCHYKNWWMRWLQVRPTTSRQ